MGQQALVRRVAASAAGGRPLVQALRGGTRFELDTRDRLQAEVFLLRRYEPGLMALLERRLRPGGTMLDVGAHVGLIALQAAALRRGAVHAFEPNPLNAARLRRNAELNPDLAVTVHELAVGAREGEVDLVWEAGHTDMAGGRVGAASGGNPGSSARVSMTTLDAFAEGHAIASVDVLKLDVEGHEPAVLDGAGRLLSERRIECLVCELNDVYLAEQGIDRTSVVTRLRDAGYRPLVIPRVGAQRLRPAREGGAVVDMAFERRP
jgi:FkbM family methyltransferase